jgi:membrane protease YdiL (CAAX protease family)
MTWVDAVLSPNYAIKSIIKLTLFLLLPIGYSFFNKEISLINLLRVDKKGIVFSLLLGIGVYLLIIFAYFILVPYFDFTNITRTLQNDIGVNKDNFVMVAIYISFINSLLEEFFFRGFAFISLKKFASRRFAYIFSAATFSLYHIAIMKSWFTPLLFALLITSLFVAGLLFNWLNEKDNNIYTSWIVHIGANFAINTIGFMLFGIL